MAKDFETVLALEANRPGICSRLRDNYGIINFRRFTEKLLLVQDEEGNDTTPVVFVIQAIDDWNGSSSAFDSFEKLQTRLGLYGRRLIVAEAKGKISLAKRLLRYDKSSPKKPKIETLIISGHGDPEKIVLTEETGEVGSIKKNDFKGKTASRLRSCLAEKASVIFASCSTGVEGGLAETAAEFQDIEVYDPHDDTILMDYLVKKEKDRVIVVPKYSHGQEDGGLIKPDGKILGKPVSSL